jgi:hypothetical protein
MFFLLGTLFLANVFFGKVMSEGNHIKMFLPISYTDLFIQQQRLRNSFLRTLLYSDYKNIKNNILLLTNCAKEKIEKGYQSFVSNYYMNCYHYYTIDETDYFMVENILQLLI